MIWALCYFTGLISCHCVSHSFSSSHSGLLAAFQTCKSCLPLRTSVLLFSLSGMSSPHILLRHSFISFRSMVKIAGGFPISSLPLFLLWVHWCTVIGPFSLTSLAAVCHYVAKFCSIKISSWIFLRVWQALPWSSLHLTLFVTHTKVPPLMDLISALREKTTNKEA